MARNINRLTAVAIRNAKPGMHADGGGLYLQVSPGTAGNTHNKSWLFRYAVSGRERQMGLGSLNTVSLAEARDMALQYRQQRQQGVDPIEARNVERAQMRTDDAKSMTFDQCSKAYIAAHRAGWSNVKHASQWTNTLATYASPVFGKLPVQTIDVGLVMKVLEPIWTTKTETATRVRERIESVLDWAGARGYRSGENPARWKGLLDKLLPKPSKVSKVKHHAALPYAEVGAFVALLRQREGVAARALEVTILTAARTGETLGAQWNEFDLQAKLWNLPAERMKMRREHHVPLSAPALAVLKRMADVRESVHVFPGGRRAVLSNMALLAVLRRMERADLTTHGFRATFKTWATECTNFPREVVEAALAHVVG
ncbi:MAG: tyrosine-type recombinase/integrase, partial [Xanthobacteraceae bacterium]